MKLPVPATPGLDCDDAQLGREITQLSAKINLDSYRLLKMIAEFDLRGGWRSGGTVRSCAHWLAAHCDMEIGPAREKVRVARRLAGLPEVEQAFSTGELSYSKVRAISRVATQSNEGLLVKMAGRTSASHLEKLVGKYQPVDETGLCSVEVVDGAEGGVFACDAGGRGADASSGDGAAVAAAAGEDAAEVGGRAAAVDEEALREHAREMYWFQDKEGMWIIHAKLPPEQGQLIVKMLEAVARPIQEERQDEWKEKQKARMQAVARHLMRRQRKRGDGGLKDDQDDVVQAEIKVGRSESGLEDGQTASAAAESVATGDRQSSNATPIAGPAAAPAVIPAAVPVSVEYQRAEEKISAESFSQFMNHVRADAFAGVAEHFLASSGKGVHSYQQLEGLKGAERCQVVLHVDINTLREQRAGLCCTHGKAHFEQKPWLSPQTARRLACDASLVTVLEDEQGRVLNVGRRSRTVPPSIRRALLEREGVCKYPGCHESKYCDAHHIEHWADGGETSLGNLVTLCKFHHRQLHRGSFEVRMESGSAESVGGELRPVFYEMSSG
jgi:Domain of unknown function (DUF222)/HNH endonuclease